MGLTWYAILAALCLSAQGKPTQRDLALDAFLAREEVVYFRQQSVVYSGALGIYLGRFDTTVPAFVESLIRKLQALNISNAEITAINTLFDSSFQNITQGAQLGLTELENVKSTSSSIISALDAADWILLREQNSNLTSQINAIASTYDATYLLWQTTKEQQEYNLNVALEGQAPSEIANVIIDWENIKNFLSNEGFIIADEHQIFKVRGDKSLDAIKIVLDQV